jgi:glyoxylase-like metal-dependent hydrolase (beta-lactamase superfamily II)
MFKNIIGNSYYYSGVFSIGAYIHNKKAIIIDSGSDDKWAKDIHKALEELDCEIIAIINTHWHPDHCGGNSYFQKLIPSIKIFATKEEQIFIEDPHCAPRCFCGGASAFSGLKNKYLAPQKKSSITNVISIYEDQDLIIDDISLKIITLPGHTFGQIGVITPDQVLYSGDTLYGIETRKKHPVLLNVDIAQALETYDKLARISIKHCIMYHGGLVQNLREIIDTHKQEIIDIKNGIVELLHQSSTLSIDQVSQQIMQKYAIQDNLVAYTLTQTTIKAFISYLEQEQVIKINIQNGLLTIQSI